MRKKPCRFRPKTSQWRWHPISVSVRFTVTTLVQIKPNGMKLWCFQWMNCQMKLVNHEWQCMAVTLTSVRYFVNEGGGTFQILLTHSLPILSPANSYLEIDLPSWNILYTHYWYNFLFLFLLLLLMLLLWWKHGCLLMFCRYSLVASQP